MGSLDYLQWELRAKKKRWDELRDILKMPWAGDRGWEGRTIGLHLPLEVRNFAIGLQEKLGMKSMKEVLFKALVIGLRELDTIPKEDAPTAPVRKLRPNVQSDRPPPPPKPVCERCGDPIGPKGKGQRCFMCIPSDQMEDDAPADAEDPA
jgi:hypothetical protein